MQDNQISIFDLLGITATPQIPTAAQKKGTKGWIISIEGVYLVENGFPENMIGVSARKVELLEDTRRDRYGWRQNARTIDHCKGDGWIGGPEPIFAKMPTWAECEEYVRTNHKGEPHDYRIVCVRKNGDATHSLCDYDEL